MLKEELALLKSDDEIFERRGKELINNADLGNQVIEKIISVIGEVAQRAGKLEGSLLETESCLVRLRELNIDLVSQLSVVSKVINAVTVGINHLPPSVGIDSGWIQECRSSAKVWVIDYFFHQVSEIFTGRTNIIVKYILNSACKNTISTF